MYTLLHISDLHRSPTEPINNDALVAALVRDHDNYVMETPRVHSPNAIVVSGDIIRGEGLGASNWKSSISSQYSYAKEFLEHLAERFVHGDRSRIVLTPGNHDVCWNTSFNAMEAVGEKEHEAAMEDFFNNKQSNYRWSWKKLRFYKIVNDKMYYERMDAYWDFVNDFYSDVDLPIPIDRGRGFQLHELDNGSIAIIVFDSTFRNDCFLTSGDLQPGVIGRCSLFLKDRDCKYKLKVAAWHHSVQGPPTASDYMSISNVHSMIGYDFQIGLHGHQHVAETTNYHLHLSTDYGMAIISAGSLCAGSKELPRGQNRQYNVIEIDDNYQVARVHVREMTEGEHFTGKRNGAFGNGYMDMKINAAVDNAGRVIQVDILNSRKVIDTAEDMMRKECYSDALLLLQKLPLSVNTYERSLAVKAAMNCSNWVQLKEILLNAESIEERSLLVEALDHLGEFDEANQVLDRMDNLSVELKEEFRNRLSIHKIMRSK